ncbi:MAG TPA: putative glycoside hydrolase [Longimicrobiales bacterium]|nr:putative glycoside hydrolase [Longimicrobiales bacterium]
MRENLRAAWNRVPPRARVAAQSIVLLLVLGGAFASLGTERIKAVQRPHVLPADTRHVALRGLGPAVVEAARLDVPPAPVLEPIRRPAPPIVPPGQRVPTPRAVRGLYVSGWVAGSGRRLAELLELADTTEINAFVVDIKDATGFVSHRTSVPFALETGADGEPRIGDIQSLLARLRQHGVYPIARIVVFKDPIAARARPDLAIQDSIGQPWIDHHGDIWVDAFNREVWDYAVALAREAIELGFSEIQWDYVRFPDAPRAWLEKAVHPARAGRSKAEAVAEFMAYAREALADLDVPITADVFGLTTSTRGDLGIGQDWLRMQTQVDVLLPMIYPSHYYAGSYGYANPNGNPYGIMRKALEAALSRAAGVEGAARVRPWIQDFTLGEPRYGPAHVRAQIQAAYDLGIDEWMLWNPGNRYTAEALVGRSGREPDFEIPDEQREEDDLLGRPGRTAGERAEG